MIGTNLNGLQNHIEPTVRASTSSQSRQFNSILSVCLNISKSMASTIRVLHSSLHRSFDSLSQVQSFDFEKLTYEISENLESFLTS